MVKPRALSAFTGLGGLDLGLEAAGFDVVGCIENARDPRHSLARNRPGWPIADPNDVQKFARTVSPRDIGLRPGDLELLVGGPPCQPFSKAAQWANGTREGVKDARGKSIYAFMRLVQEFRPRVVLIENVPGFVSGPGSALAYLERKFKAINHCHGTRYVVQYSLLNAADYGIPQQRTRAIVIASQDEGILFPTPTHASSHVRAWDAFAEIGDTEQPALRGKWAPLLPSIPEGSNYLWHTERGGGLPLFGYRTRYWSFLLKLAKDQPSWTLPAHPGPATGPFHWDNRPLSIKEMLRLQTFPSSWRVEGTFGSRVRQVGNATPPLLGEVLGRTIGATIFGCSYSDPLKYRISRKRIIPRPRAVEAVPEEFLRLRGTHAAHPGPGGGPRALRRAQVT